MPDSLRFSHHSREVSAAAVELTRVTVTVRCAVEESVVEIGCQTFNYLSDGVDS